MKINKLVDSFLRTFVMFVALGGYAWLVRTYPVFAFVLGLTSVFAFAWYFSYKALEENEN